MERIVVSGFGTVTEFDAAHVVAGDRIVAFFPEPQARQDFNSGEINGFDEATFRTAVRSAVEGFEDPVDVIVFDQARDKQSEERLGEGV